MIDQHSALILDHLQDGVVIVDHRGMVRFANPAAKHLLPADATTVDHPFAYDIHPDKDIYLNGHHAPPSQAIEMRSTSTKWYDADAYLVTLRDVTEQRQAEQSLAVAESLSNAILNSLHASIAVLDANGLIVRVNDNWVTFAQDNGDPTGEATGIGINYFEVCERSGDPTLKDVLDGMIAVQKGDRASYEIVYPCHAPHEERWFMMRVRPLIGDTQPGLVVAHINITDYRHYLLERRQQPSDALIRLEAPDVEFLALEMLAFPTGRPSTDPLDADMHEQAVTRYVELLDLSLHESAYRVEVSRLTQESEVFAEFLGINNAHPRDLIRVHREALTAKRAALRKSSPKLSAIMEEGRILLLQVMGYLAAFYRNLHVSHTQSSAVES